MMTDLSSLPLGDFYRGRLLNFAHRGARRQAPENTLPAFERAVELGADGIELDVHLSADGVPVVIHDFDVDKTTDGTGAVAKKTLAELRELDAGAHFSPQFAGTRIPTLMEVFEAVGNRVLINIELKSYGSSPQLAQAVIDQVGAFNLIGRVLISSFSPFVLRQVRRLRPELPVGYLYAPDLPLPLAKGWLARPVIGVHEARHPHFSMVDERYMDWARKNRYRVNVWTVNEPSDIERMRRLGVDMIISDYPERVRDVLRAES